MKPRSPSRWAWITLIGAVCTLIYLIRLFGPTDLESYAQDRSIGYTLDLMIQGHWRVQHDLKGAIMSAPPLHTWLLALSSTLLGLGRTALTLPSFLAVLALSLLVFEVARRRFGELAAGFAALAIALSPTMAMQIALVRNDPLFALTVAAAAFSAFFAWEQGKAGSRSWLLFWIVAALATLSQGLAGIVLAAVGLPSLFWAKDNVPHQPAPRGRQVLGPILFLLLTAGWLVLAWLNTEDKSLLRLIIGELVYPPSGTPQTGKQAADLLKPMFFLLMRYLPFSIPLFFGLWRVFRQPATDPGERRFERFLACWILLGLLLLALARYQHPEQLLPLWPACAVLAGREMARFAERIGVTRFAGMGTVIACMLIGSTYNAVHAPRGPRENSSAYGQELKLAQDIEHAAEAFKASDIDARTLSHLDTPASLQMHLGTYRPCINAAQLEQRLAETDAPVNLALGATDIEELGLAARYPKTERLFRYPDDDALAPILQIYRIAREAPGTNR